MKHRDGRREDERGGVPDKTKEIALSFTSSQSLLVLNVGVESQCWKDFIKRTVANEWERPCGELQLCLSFCMDHLTGDSR